jgi:hypothetical protein
MENIQMKFHELPPAQQEKIIRKIQSDGSCYPNYDWWDHIYECFYEFCEKIGVYISITERRFTRRNGTQGWTKEYDITFDLGGGRSVEFDAVYRPIRSVIPELYSEDVARAYTALRSFELGRSLQRLPEFTASIRGSEVSSVDEDSYDEEDFNSGESEVFEELLQEVINELSDMLRKDLQNEYDYYGTEEYIRDTLENSDEDYEMDEEDADII